MDNAAPAQLLASAETHIHIQSEEQIRSWIVHRLARMLGVKPETIGLDDPLVEYGLESVEAIALSGDLSDHLGRRWPPTLVWDYPTIAEMSRFLAAQMKGGVAP
jgi:acyl carrier protein